MVAAGIDTIRVGESVWSTWEPREGRFDLDWLAPVLDEAHRRGIAAIVGTPTYAVPPWLRRVYPELAARTATGVVQPYGARQDVDYTHPGFRHLAERLIRRIVERYRGPSRGHRLAGRQRARASSCSTTTPSSSGSASTCGTATATSTR